MEGNAVFIVMVFITVFLLAQGMVVPVFGESRQVRNRLKHRLANIDRAADGEGIASILRAKYLSQLSPWEKVLESLPVFENLTVLIEQSGHSIRANRLVFLALILGFLAAAICWMFMRMLPLAVVAGLVAFSLPFLKIRQDRNARMAKFEEQLPEAVDIMRRALMAGHPFNAALNLVAEDMAEPIATEFRLTFADLNYGNDVRRAMLGLLGRVPSVTVMALVTSVLVQRETGGNLAEVLSQISKVIRSRFRFHRRVKTLSAEGRLSAWILAMVPLVMFAAISFIAPDYLPILFESPTGRNVVMGTFIWACLGVFWIRRIIRIDV